jgi:TonB family protein
MRTCCRFLIMAVVATRFFFLQAFPKDNKEQEAAELEEKAKRVMDLRSPGSPPFRLMEDVRVWTKEGKGVNGSYTLLWVGPDQWRDELTLPGYHEIRVGGQQFIWRLRSRPAWTEAAARAWLAVSLSYKLGQVKPDRGIRRIYETKAGEATAKCISAQPSQSYGAEECFDAGQGFLVHTSARDLTGTRSTELSDYTDLGGHFLPRQRRDFRKGKLVAEADVREASLLREVDPAIFSPPAGAVRVPHCENPVPPTPTSHPEPPYPNWARINRISGTVALDVQIDAQGRIEDAAVVQALNPGLDLSAVETIKKSWRFEPATCSGVPVPFEFLVEVSFRLF